MKKSVENKSKKWNHSDELSQKTKYKKYLEELEDPNYSGGSWALPESLTPLEQTKYKICKQVVSYKLDKKVSTEEIVLINLIKPSRSRGYFVLSHWSLYP